MYFPRHYAFRQVSGFPVALARLAGRIAGKTLAIDGARAEYGYVFEVFTPYQAIVPMAVSKILVMQFIAPVIGFCFIITRASGNKFGRR